MPAPKKANPKPNPKRANSRKKPEQKSTDVVPVPAEDLKMLQAFHREYVEAGNEAKSRYEAMVRQIGVVKEEAEIPEGLVLNAKTWVFEKPDDPRQAEKDDADKAADDACPDDAKDADDGDAASADKKPEVGKPDVEPAGSDE
jgi:hypothetical protein